MVTVPVPASAMPVPEPVPAVVIVTVVTVVLYAVCQAPKSGNISVLPVSVTATPVEEEALAAGDDDGVAAVVELPPELPQAASRASGTSAAAVHAMRILLATSEYSFVSARFHVRYIDSRADACDEARAASRGPCPRAGGVLSSRAGGSLWLAEPAADVASGLLLGRVLENLLGLAVLDQAALVKEDRPVRDPAGLGEVVGDDHHGEPGHQGADERLDRLGRDRVQ